MKTIKIFTAELLKRASVELLIDNLLINIQLKKKIDIIISTSSKVNYNPELHKWQHDSTIPLIDNNIKLINDELERRVDLIDFNVLMYHIEKI